MRYLVMGCNGMAGHMVSLFLKEAGHIVTGFARQDSGIVDTIIGDAGHLEQVAHILEDGQYDFVINCIGVLNQFAEEEKARAVFLNAYLPHFLEDNVRGCPTRILHLSTDCVFSGDRGGYVESDLRDGNTFYDRSKALGEIEGEGSITIRTSIVGPDRNEEGIGLLNWFMRQESKLNGYSRAIWTGVTTLQLAKVIESMTCCTLQKYKLPYYQGIYHVVPDHSISKYELLQLFNRYIRNGTMEICEDDTVVVDKSLRATRPDFEIRIPEYEDMVSELALWMQRHKELYNY